LQDRARHFSKKHKETNIKVGEVVLIEEENVKRSQWRAGVIEKILPSVDGVTRAVTLRTTNGHLNRPVQRLYAFELNENEQPTVDEEKGEGAAAAPSTETGDARAFLTEEVAETMEEESEHSTNSEEAEDVAAAAAESNEGIGNVTPGGAPTERAEPAKGNRISTTTNKTPSYRNRAVRKDRTDLPVSQPPQREAQQQGSVENPPLVRLRRNPKPNRKPDHHYY
jgi:hypothetical protein